MTNRELRTRIRKIVETREPDQAARDVAQWPARQVVNPLIMFLCDADSLVKWRSVSVLGRVVARLADEEPESARVVMRRFLWQLNEESGGIGWGICEALAESMVHHEKLAAEYANLLVSYIDPATENFLEMDALRQGALWGVARLAEFRPERMAHAVGPLTDALNSNNAALVALAARALKCLGHQPAKGRLEALKDDPRPVTLYQEPDLVTTSVGQVVEQAC